MNQPLRYGKTPTQLVAFRLATRLFDAIEGCECSNCGKNCVPCESCDDCRKKLTAIVERSLVRLKARK